LISDFTTSVKIGFGLPGKPNHHSGNTNKKPRNVNGKGGGGRRFDRRFDSGYEGRRINSVSRNHG
jgi:hypothetical protein